MFGQDINVAKRIQQPPKQAPILRQTDHMRLPHFQRPRTDVCNSSVANYRTRLNSEKCSRPESAASSARGGLCDVKTIDSCDMQRAFFFVSSQVYSTKTIRDGEEAILFMNTVMITDGLLCGGLGPFVCGGLKMSSITCLTEPKRK